LGSGSGLLHHYHLPFPQLEVAASREIEAGSFGPAMCPAQEAEELSQEEQSTWEVAFCFGYVPTQEEPFKMRKITCYPITLECKRPMHVKITQASNQTFIKQNFNTKQKVKNESHLKFVFIAQMTNLLV
jgi:hypothetical protein